MRYNSEWHRVKERILRRLTKATENNPTEAVQETLSFLPETKPPLIFRS